MDFGLEQLGRDRNPAGAWHDEVMMGVLAREFARNHGFSDALPAAQGHST